MARRPAGRAGQSIKPWQVRGDVTLGADRIAVEQLQHRVRSRRGRRPARLCVAGRRIVRRGSTPICAPANSISMRCSASATARSPGSGLEWPREIALALEVGRARIAGFEARNSAARLKFDAGGIADRAAVGRRLRQRGDRGQRPASTPRRRRAAASPSISMRASSTRVIALAEKFAPALADPLRRMAGAAEDREAARHRQPGTRGGRQRQRQDRAGRPDRRGAARLSAPAPPASRSTSSSPISARLRATEVRFDGRFEADEAAKLLALIGLDRLAARRRRRPAVRRGSTSAATGPLNRELRIDGKLAAGAVDADGKGTLRLPADAAGDARTRSGVRHDRRPQGAGTARASCSASRRASTARSRLKSLDAPAIVAAAIGMRARRRDALARTEPFAPSASDLARPHRDQGAARGALADAGGASSCAAWCGSDRRRSCSRTSKANWRMAGSSGRLAFVTGAGRRCRARGSVALSGADAAAIVAGDAGDRRSRDG